MRGVAQIRLERPRFTPKETMKTKEAIESAVSFFIERGVSDCSPSETDIRMALNDLVSYGHDYDQAWAVRQVKAKCKRYYKAVIVRGL
jgi:hypothetical protein